MGNSVWYIYTGEEMGTMKGREDGVLVRKGVRNWNGEARRMT